MSFDEAACASRAAARAGGRAGPPRPNGEPGGSYAGGIQTATSSIDPWVDAIAPEISWADLRYSLYSGEVLNLGWTATLYAAGCRQPPAWACHRTARASPRGWPRAPSPTTCWTSSPAPAWPTTASRTRSPSRRWSWDTSVDTGAPVTYRTNAGEWRDAADFPPPSFGTLTAEGEGSLVSVPFTDTPDPSELEGYLSGLQAGGIPALPITTAQPANDAELANGQAFSIPVTTAEDGAIELLGIPDVELTVSGTGTEVVLFAKLVDRQAGEVVNLQEGAIRVPLGDGEQTVDVPMSGLAYTLPEGHDLDLQVSTASLMHANARTPAQVDVAVAADVPADVPPARGGPDTPGAPGDTPADGRPSPDDDVAAAGAPLPATGASLPLLLPLLALAVVAPRQRR